MPENTFYLGSLKKSGANDLSDPVLERAREKKQGLVYITIGGASQSGVSIDLFQLFNDAFSHLPYIILISTGGKPIPSLAELGENIFFEKWVNNNLILNHAETVIFHGGSTRLEILQHGLRSIAIPFQSEQEHYARRMEELKISRYLPYSDEPYTHRVSTWRGGKLTRKQPFSIFFRKNPTLNSETLKNTLLEVLDNSSMQQNAQKIKREFDQLNGCELGIQIIQEYFR